MPVFNERPDFLEKAINSILFQTFPDFELVILDDGSDEESTIQILTLYEKKDSRVRLYRDCNRGYTRALNLGLPLCRGELICRHDSDDWSELVRIEKQVTFMDENHNIGLVGGNITFHREDGTPLWKSCLPCDSGDVMAAFHRINPFIHGSVCFRKVVFEAVGGYRNQLEPTEDYDLFWRICERFGGANLPGTLYHHRRTTRSVSTTRARDQIKKACMVRLLAKMRQCGEHETITIAEENVETMMGSDLNYLGTLYQATHLTVAGHYRNAMKLYVRGILINPLRVQGYLKLARLFAFILLPSLGKRLFV